MEEEMETRKALGNEFCLSRQGTILSYFTVTLHADAFKTSPVETIWSQDSTEDERAWGGSGG